MKVLKVKKVEDCLEATNVRDIILSRQMDKRFIFYLGQLGKLVYNDNFDKPFFSIIVRGKYTLKGAETNKIIRVMLPEEAGDEMIPGIKNFIETYK